MGAIKTTELSNGNIGLEITYGGKEAPFGGVDTSAPPAYIDPNCFAATDSHVVIDNKLVAVSLQPLAVPAVLWNGVVGVIILEFGTFYNSIYGQLNYALGYTAAPFGAPGTSPTGVAYTFYMTSWLPNDITQYFTDVLPISLFDAVSIQSSASITLDIIASNAVAVGTGAGATGTITSVSAGSGTILAITMSGGAGFGLGDVIQVVPDGYIPGDYGWVRVTGISGSSITTVALETNTGYGYVTGTVTSGLVEAQSGLNIVINGPAGGPNTYHLPASSSGYTRQSAVAAMVAQINTYNDPNVAASASADGYSLVLTAFTPGPTGNAITVQDVSTSENAALAPPFYFSARQLRYLEGGLLAQSFSAPRDFAQKASTADVGGTIYIANLGPMILKYSGPGSFTTSTLYNGVDVLRKFAGSLIGLRLNPQLGTSAQNTDMIFAWSGAENLDEWAPVTTQGFVTGAGFEQIADIGDYLAGLIVSSGTAFIIRAQGISYATATDNASSPFAIAHIGLGDQGEGGQISSLICQYDQTGVYVGGSDIYQFSGQISAIGTKIACTFFTDLTNAGPGYGNVMDSAACAVLLGGSEFPLVALGLPINTQGSLSFESYLYNPQNKTWMIITYCETPFTSTAARVFISPVSTFNNFAVENQYNQTLLGYAMQEIYSGVYQVPHFFSLAEGVPNVNSISNPSTIFFPVEELVFGRDITIDSLYVALNGVVSEDVFIDFSISGIFFATLVLTATIYNSFAVNPIESQLFPPSTGTGPFTVKSPQLSYVIRSITDTGTAQVRFTKIMMLGSMDPNQRPT